MRKVEDEPGVYPTVKKAAMTLSSVYMLLRDLYSAVDSGQITTAEKVRYQFDAEFYNML